MLMKHHQNPIVSGGLSRKWGDRRKWYSFGMRPVTKVPSAMVEPLIPGKFAQRCPLSWQLPRVDEVFRRARCVERSGRMSLPPKSKRLPRRRIRIGYRFKQC